MSPPLTTLAQQACPSCMAVFRQRFPLCPLDGTPLEPVDMESLPLCGQVLGERYHIEVCIGEGGMGQVYRAKHTRISRRFAIKVLYGDLIADSNMRERFSREAEAASRLSHPNLVGVVDFGETPEGLLYLVMEYVDGRSLAHLIASEGALGFNRAAGFLRQLAAGLEHAHEQRLVHRDFKPDNVMVTEGAEGEVAKILDFGIVRLMGDGSPRTLTTDGVFMGTPEFASPEQASADVVDHRTDLFSLGLVAYQMITGVLPFDGDRMAILRQNMVIDPPPMKTRAAGIDPPPWLEAMVHKLQAKEPDERYQSATDLIAELDERFSPIRRRRGSTASGSADPYAPTGRADQTPLPVAFASTVHSSASSPELGESAQVQYMTTGHHGQQVPAAHGMPEDQRARRRRLPMAMVLGAMALLGVAALVLLLGPDSAETDTRDGQHTSATVVEGPETNTKLASYSYATVSDSGADVTQPVVERELSSPDGGESVGADQKTDESAAARTSRRSKRNRRENRRDGRDRKSKAPEPVTSKQFIKRYNKVAAQLQQLRQGAADNPTVDQLQQRFRAIDYNSFKDADRRERNYRKLGSIQARIHKVQK